MDYRCTICKKEFDEEPDTFNSGGMVQAIICPSCAERVSQFIFETLPYELEKEKELLPW